MKQEKIESQQVKLTAPQKEVIRKLRDGWELKYSSSSRGNFQPWTSFERGKERARISRKTIDVLSAHSLIKDDYRIFHTCTLTELGKTIEL